MSFTLLRIDTWPNTWWFGVCEIEINVTARCLFCVGKAEKRWYLELFWIRLISPPENYLSEKAKKQLSRPPGNWLYPCGHQRMDAENWEILPDPCEKGDEEDSTPDPMDDLGKELRRMGDEDVEALGEKK